MVAVARPARSVAIDTNLTLFAPDPREELERAKIIVRELAPLDCNFTKTTGKKAASPFWVSHYTRDGKRMRHYIGSDAKLDSVKKAQQLVRDHMKALGLEPPRPRSRKKKTTTTAAPPRLHKSPTATGGGRRLAAATVRDTADAHAPNAPRGRSPRRAGAGSRRRP